MSRRPRQGRRGFTLIEVLVAVVIFVLLAAAAYSALDTLIRTRIGVQQRAQSLHQLQRAMGRFERDLRQTVARGISNEFGERRPALHGSTTRIELSRAGLANPLAATRAGIERVVWYVDGQNLQRAPYAVLDRAVNSKPAPAPMLDRIERIALNYYDGERWRNDWPPPNSATDARDKLPRAVALVIDSERFGELRRVIELVDNPPPPGVGAAPESAGASR
ncbi:MAG: type II secretion system minor pseudopilin GspJ [Gammaproteobacteria bacterium]